MIFVFPVLLPRNMPNIWHGTGNTKGSRNRRNSVNYKKKQRPHLAGKYSKNIMEVKNEGFRNFFWKAKPAQ